MARTRVRGLSRVRGMAWASMTTPEDGRPSTEDDNATKENPKHSNSKKLGLGLGLGFGVAGLIAFMLSHLHLSERTRPMLMP
ncbi:hypothetical protein CEP51_009296, partial [Fusarium floridanum]